jgi:hypothetical protein
MYGKFFAQAFTGSMMAAGAEVFAVWAYVIANTRKAKVDLNPVLLAALIGSTPERMEAAIKTLCAPDPRSRTKAEDGRRLIAEDGFQYRVVNHEQYRSMLNEDDRREYFRTKKREQRQRDSAVKQSVKDSPRQSKVSTQAEAESKAEAEASKRLTATQSPGGVPPCPHQEILQAWKEILPELPQPKTWTKTRSAHLQARWRERWVERAAVKGWKTQADGLKAWRTLFKNIRSSPFLMGQTEPPKGRPPFKAELPWIVMPENYAKLIEGKYHPEVEDRKNGKT